MTLNHHQNIFLEFQNQRPLFQQRLPMKKEENY